jgi:hypothetical protein
MQRCRTRRKKWTRVFFEIVCLATALATLYFSQTQFRTHGRITIAQSKRCVLFLFSHSTFLTVHSKALYTSISPVHSAFLAIILTAALAPCELFSFFSTLATEDSFTLDAFAIWLGYTKPLVLVVAFWTVADPFSTSCALLFRRALIAAKSISELTSISA